jgi:hypothetical protein
VVVGGEAPLAEQVRSAPPAPFASDRIVVLSAATLVD